jgi:RNase P subunit RPR2
MVDHVAMRNAVNRALEEIHNAFCNSCKNPYNNDSGEFIDLVTLDKIYKIWYCQDCVSNESV